MTATPTAPISLIASCIDCGTPIAGRDACEGCGRPHPVIDGLLHARNPLRGRNRVAHDFYDGPNWARFRPWERLFLRFQGGLVGARRQILDHLPATPGLRVLEVGIGDGENVPLLPPSWEVYGVDFSRNRLGACVERFPGMAGRLALAEAERLPFGDDAFDVALSVGGFNYVRDHAAALAEMRRVTRPRGTMVVADEIPTLVEFSVGRLLGIDAIDTWSLTMLGLNRDFVDMIRGLRLDLDAAARRAWPGHARYPIWNRLGYCLVESEAQADARARARAARRSRRCR